MNGEGFPNTFASKIKISDVSINEENTNKTYQQNFAKMLLTADNKCTQLKGKLDQMRNRTLNDLQTTILPDKKVVTGSPPNLKNIVPATELSLSPLQGSSKVETDKSGGALRALKDILVEIISPIQSSDIGHDEVIHGTENINLNTKKANQHKKNEIINNKIKNVQKTILSKAISVTGIKDKKKIGGTLNKNIKMNKSSYGKNVNAVNRPNRVVDDIDNKIPNQKNEKRSNNLQKKETKRPFVSKDDVTNPDLVELYHNKLVKDTNSSYNYNLKNKNKQQKAAKEDATVPPLPVIESTEYYEGDCKRTNKFGTRSYANPTVSSKMKKVAKYYMNNFSLKTIPFCTATSIGPSHNIGINIQQVMNMVKNKQTAGQKLSPTLAYNIVLAAEKWGDKDSLFNSECNPSSACPLAQQQQGMVNFNHYQEMAKNIPERDQPENDENNDDDNDIEEIYITGPSGDVKVQNRKQPKWSTEPSDNCTCTPTEGVDFQHILHKYGSKCQLKHNSPSKATVKIAALEPNKETFIEEPEIDVNVSNKTSVQRLFDRSNLHSSKLNISKLNAEQPDFLDVEEKERQLKDVMNRLYDEFDVMNKRYEELTREPSEEHITKDLEQLDLELNRKETEILTVMSLYKEVENLKQQLSSLKKKHSSNPLNVKKTSSKLNKSSCGEITTAALLNKLLRQVQHFQNNYKRSK